MLPCRSVKLGSLGGGDRPGPTQVILVRDTVGEEEVCRACYDVPAAVLGFLAVRLQPVIAKGADIASDRLAAVVHLSRILETLASNFEEKALLGVASLNFRPGHGEKGCIETSKIVCEEVPLFGLDAPSALQGVVEAIAVERAIGDGAASISAVEQKIPELIRVLYAPGQAHAQAADGDGCYSSLTSCREIIVIMTWGALLELVGTSESCREEGRGRGQFQLN